MYTSVHLHSKDESKTLQISASLTQRISSITLTRWVRSVHERHRDTFTGDQGRMCPSAQKSHGAHLNRPTLCNYWRVSLNFGWKLTHSQLKQIAATTFPGSCCTPQSSTPSSGQQSHQGSCLAPAVQDYIPVPLGFRVSTDGRRQKKNEHILLCTPFCWGVLAHLFRHTAEFGLSINLSSSLTSAVTWCRKWKPIQKQTGKG